MADATTAAKERIDLALAVLERKVLDLRARPAGGPPIADDDLFAPREGPSEDAARIADLEAAGRDASVALAAAAAAVRELLNEPA